VGRAALGDEPWLSVLQRDPRVALPIAGAAHPAQGPALRVFYAFDPDRQAVLLMGGDKTGDPRFYEEQVPRAEAIWELYLREHTRRRSEE
jgi:Phage derived protein Gp49-like (DUF891)